MHTIFTAVLALGYCHLCLAGVGSDEPIQISWLAFSGYVGHSNVSFFKEHIGLEFDSNSNEQKNSTLCQAFYSETWIPGKHVEDACYVARHGVEHGFLDFRVAQVEPYEVSWIPLPANGRTLPSKAIVGGKHGRGDYAYICRAYITEDNNINVISGAYSAIDHACYIPNHGAEMLWTGDTEILVYNALGVASKFSQLQ